MCRLFAVGRVLIGSLPPMPGVYPDMAPTVRVADGSRELALRDRELPGPPRFDGTVRLSH